MWYFMGMCAFCDYIFPNIYVCGSLCVYQLVVSIGFIVEVLILVQLIWKKMLLMISALLYMHGVLLRNIASYSMC